MSFDSRNLILARGDANNYGTLTGMVFHTYADSVNTLATITAGGFFPPFFGADEQQVVAGDVISIRDSSNSIKDYRIDTVDPIALTALDTGANPFDQDLNTTDSPSFTGMTLTGTGILTAATGDFSTGINIQSGGGGINLPTTGETPTLLSFYKEFTDASFTFAASPWNSPIAVILRADRLNERCTVRLNNAAAAATSADFIKSTSTLPTWLRPSEDSWCALPIISNGANLVGKAVVRTTGIIEIFSETSAGNFATPSTAGWLTSAITYYIQDQ